jgi:hypothetical protein
MERGDLAPASWRVHLPRCLALFRRGFVRTTMVTLFTTASLGHSARYQYDGGDKWTQRLACTGCAKYRTTVVRRLRRTTGRPTSPSDENSNGKCPVQNAPTHGARGVGRGAPCPQGPESPTGTQDQSLITVVCHGTAARLEHPCGSTRQDAGAINESDQRRTCAAASVLTAMGCQGGGSRQDTEKRVSESCRWGWTTC